PLEVAGEAPLVAGQRPLLSAASGPVVVLADHSRVEGLAIVAAGPVAIAGEDVGEVHLAGLQVDGALRLRNPTGLVRVEASDLRARGEAPLSVESKRGEARLELDGIALDGGEATSDGIAVRCGGGALLTVVASSLVLEG